MMVNDRNLLIVFRNLIATAACAAILTACNIPKPASLSAVAPPTGVTAKAGDALVTVTWIASVGATSYKVYRSQVSRGPYAQIATTNNTTYTDSTVTNGTTYYYVVSAVDASGEGDYSAQSIATPVAPTTPPPTPTNLTATAGDGQATIAWSASSSVATYRVKRSTSNGGPYVQIAAPTTTSYVDNSLTNDTTYYFVISAVNSIGESANSNQVSVMPVVMNPPPTTFGTWVNVTPPGVDLTGAVTCGNPYTNSVQRDPNSPSRLYAQFSCQGIWRSDDFGISWTGPINSGANGAAAADCEGGITVAPNSLAIPVIYQSCIRGSATGFWKSEDGGVSWSKYIIVPTARQDYLNPVVDPYDPNHLLMTAHEFNSIVESTDGGQSWASVTEDTGMLLTAQNSFIFFINTGNASSTRGSWLWIAGGGGGGTWRTTTGGNTWERVDSNEALFGSTQIYQPDNNGVVFMPGVSSALGWGVLRSTDYGATWTHVGKTVGESTVFGTSKNVYTMSGTADKNFLVASQPGTGQWVSPATPASLGNGTAQVAVVNDGANNIFLGAMWQAGLWRYVEP